MSTILDQLYSAHTKTQQKYKVGICGATGYAGGELVRRLLMHPAVEICYITSRQGQGQCISEIYPSLAGLSTLALTNHEALEVAQNVDVLFLALPHKATMETVSQLFDQDGQPLTQAKIIDLSGDFRLNEPQTYTAHYKKEHSCPHLLKSFVYGMSEWHKDLIAQANYVANPGCFATAINLALAPLASAGLLPQQVSVFAATGSTGSGATPVAGTHHPQRTNNFKVYKVLSHQHVPEIEMFLSGLGADKPHISFIPASAPMSHGIFVTAHMCLPQVDEAAKAITEAYQDASFIRLRTESPQVSWVKNTNFADIAVFVQEGELVVTCVIDNLVKGASGQAIHNMNLMLGLDEHLGLLHSFPQFP
mgnify:CR=1 FL=1